MTSLSRSLGSSVGRKMVVAVTGLALLGFVIGHMAGNLQMFLGQDALNSYAALLKSKPGLLWGARLGLLAFVGAHIVLALKLAAENKAARPGGYAAHASIQSTANARTMTLTGLMIVAFVVYHLAHLTWGVTNPADHALVETLADGTTRPDVFSAVVLGFQNPLIAGAYVVAMVLLGLHIGHGIQSVFQTLGLTSSHSRGTFQKLGAGLTWLIVIGNCAMPIAVLAGVITLPEGVGS